MSLTTPIADSLKLTDFIMSLVTNDLDDATARRQARDGEGASIAWIIGHLCHYRYELMKLLGHDVPSPFARTFGKEGATDGADYPSVEELRASWMTISKKVAQVLGSATDEQLTAPMGEPSSPHGEKSILDTIVFYTWHESYHMGQLGTLRAQFGLTPTATLAMEAAAAST